jgi:hypothetical protein
MNDNIVRVVPAKYVLSQQAYLLFYSRKYSNVNDETMKINAATIKTETVQQEKEEKIRKTVSINEIITSETSNRHDDIGTAIDEERLNRSLSSNNHIKKLHHSNDKMVSRNDDDENEIDMKGFRYRTNSEDLGDYYTEFSRQHYNQGPFDSDEQNGHRGKFRLRIKYSWMMKPIR